MICTFRHFAEPLPSILVSHKTVFSLKITLAVHNIVCACILPVVFSGFVNVKASCTLDPTREAKQIRTRNSLL